MQSTIRSSDEAIAEGAADRVQDPAEKLRDTLAYKISEALLDRDFYFSVYGDLSADSVDPVLHFMTHGWKEGRDPSPAFSTREYMRDHDLDGSKDNPLVHYGLRRLRELNGAFGERHGYLEYKLTEMQFDREYYLRNNPDLLESEIDPVSHYMRIGWSEGRNPSPSFNSRDYAERYNLDRDSINPLLHNALQIIESTARKETLSDGQMIELSLVRAQLDETFYRTRYQDIGSREIDPAEHYSLFGWREGRDPSPLFSTSRYIKAHGLEGKGINPLVHHGIELIRNALGGLDLEHKLIEAQFDRDFYLKTYADVAAAGIDPVVHYRYYGYKEGRNPSPTFGTSYYMREHELAGKAINPLVHHGLRILENTGRILTNTSRTASQHVEIKDEDPSRALYRIHSEISFSNDAPKLFSYRELNTDKPVVLLVIFCHDPRLSRIQRTICEEYLKLDVNLVVLLHQPIRLTPEDSGVPEGVHAVICRQNAGFDFGGWRDAHALLGAFTDYPRVILTNDSLIPVSAGVGATIAAHASSKADWLFSTHNLEVSPHGQTFLMSYDPGRFGHLIHEVFAIDDLKTKQDVIDKVEIPLAERISSLGFTVDFLLREDCYHPSKRDLNPTLHSAQQLVEHGFAFVKAEYLTNKIGEMGSWLADAFEPERLRDIQEHLNRRYPNWDDEASIGLGVPQGVPARKRRVILMGHNAEVGGAQRLLLALAKTLTSVLDYEIMIILADGGANLRKYKDIAPTFIVGGNPALLENVLRTARMLGFHDCIANTAVALRFLERVHSYGIKTVCLVHEMAESIEFLGLGNVVRGALPVLEKVVYPSEETRRSVETAYGAARGNVMVRRQGHFRITRADGAAVQPRVQPPEEIRALKEKGTRIVLCVGTLEGRKGFDRFHRTALAYRVAHPSANVRFVWVGSPQKVCDVQAELDVARQDGSVLLIPNIDEDVLFAIYEVADAYFFASRNDPMPYAVVDALMAGLPVVGFRGVGGCDSLIAEFGKLLPDADDLEARLAALERYLADREPEQTRSLRTDYIEQNMDFDDYVVELLAQFGHFNPKVDVAVPNYRHERFLPARIDSIVSQSYKYMNLILLDDCSGDASIEIMRRHSRSFSRFTREKFNEVNSGNSYKQWELARTLASAELLWIAESDDVCSRSFLAHMVKAFQDTKVALGFSQTWFINQDGKKFGAIQDDFKPLHPYLWNNSYKASGMEEIRRVLSQANTLINVSSVVFRREAIPDFCPEIQIRRRLGALPEDVPRRGYFLRAGSDELLPPVFWRADIPDGVQRPVLPGAQHDHADGERDRRGRGSFEDCHDDTKALGASASAGQESERISLG